MIDLVLCKDCANELTSCQCFKCLDHVCDECLNVSQDVTFSLVCQDCLDIEDGGEYE